MHMISDSQIDQCMVPGLKQPLSYMIYISRKASSIVRKELQRQSISIAQRDSFYD